MAQARTKKAPQRWSAVQNRDFYRLALLVMILFFRHWVRRYRFIGVGNVPADGGAFLISNHTSGMDPLILGGAVPHRLMSGPGKIELFQNPVFAYLLRKLGIFPLRPGKADSSAVRTMVDLYRHGRVVIIYPEGGRSNNEEMMPFTPDFARLVIKLRAPVVPAGIAGARDLLPIGKWVPRPNRPVVVNIGECFELTEFYGQPLTPESLQQATEILHGRVSALLEGARREREILLRGR